MYLIFKNGNKDKIWQKKSCIKLKMNNEILKNRQSTIYSEGLSWINDFGRKSSEWLIKLMIFDAMIWV